MSIEVEKNTERSLPETNEENDDDVLSEPQQKSQIEFCGDVTLCEQPDEMSSSLPIGVSDIDHLTTISLHRCQDLVVTHYNTLLVLIGWQSFTKTTFNAYTPLWLCLNYFYVGIVVLLIFFSYIYDALFDNGKYLSHKTNTSANTSLLMSSRHQFNQICCNASDTSFTSRLITTYIIPSIVHVVAYTYGFLHFRVRENEQLDVVMEKVFLRAQSTFGVQRRLIQLARWYLVASGTWIILVLATTSISIAAFQNPVIYVSALAYQKLWSKYLLIGLNFIGKLLSSCVYVAIVVNYATQCEFFIFTIHCLSLQLQEKTLFLHGAMQEILGIKELLSLLNGPLSKMTSLCILNFAVLCTIGFVSLTANNDNENLVWICYVMFPCLWIPMLFFPLIQAARVTKAGDKLRQISFQMRVFGYKNSSSRDLDSFIIFVGSAQLRTKMYSIPIKPAYLMSSLTLLIFILIIFFQ